MTRLLPAFPDRPIRMVFGFAPGGSGDLAARLLADVAGRVVQRWEEAIRTAVNDPEVSRKLLDNGMVPAFQTPPASPAPWTRIAAATAR